MHLIPLNCMLINKYNKAFSMKAAQTVHSYTINDDYSDTHFKTISPDPPFREIFQSQISSSRSSHVTAFKTYNVHKF